MKENNFDKITTIVARFVLVILIILLIILLQRGINQYIELVSKVEKLSSKIQEIEKDNEELWKNIDAISEDYTTLWVQLYGEDSWYEKPEDKEKVHKEIENMKGE